MRIRSLVALALLLATVPAFAQQTAAVRGTVLDAQGEVVANAAVTAINVDTGFTRNTNTSPSGTYQLGDLLVGTYIVTVEAEGFKAAVTQNVILSVGETRRIDIALEVGAVTEAVTVTSDALTIQTIGGEVAGLITGEQVRELPLNGRNFLQLTQLMPGVSTGDNFNVKNKGLLTGSDMSVAGSRATGNMWTVDGANNNDVGSQRTILVYPSLEAVEEFKIHRNSYGAEFGGAGGAQVNLVTRGGTNNLRGSVFYFGRRGSWNETNFILKQAGAEADELTRDDYGFTLGGAFIKDKLHFFASTEYNDEVRGVGRTGLVPSAAERQGDFSNTDFSCWPQPIDPLTGQPFPGNVIPADRLSDAGIDFLNLYPLPTGTGSGCDNWTTSLNVPINWKQYNARLDWSVTERARVMVRYTQDDWDNNSPTAGDANGLWGDDAFPNVDSNWAQPSDSLVAQINNTIGNSALNTFTYTKSGNEINIGQGGDPALQAAIRATNPPIFPESGKTSAPNTAHPIFWGGGGLAGVWQAGPWQNEMEHQVLKDDYEQVFGKHVLKAGILYSQSNKAEPAFANASQESPIYWGAAGLNGWGNSSTGNIVSDFLLEDMTFGFSEFSYNNPGNVEWTDLEMYVADSWKIRDNMTLDVGLRYSRMAWPENDNPNTYLNFNPDRWDPAFGASPCNGLMQVPGSDPCGAAGLLGASNGPNAALINDNNNFAPRLGFAWDVFRTGNSVFRAGFGQFFQRERVSPNLGLLNNPPAVQFISGARSLDGDILLAGPAGLGIPSRGIDVNAGTPYMYQYNLTWEQRVGRDSTVEVSYVGSQGRDLLRSVDVNQVPLGADVNGNGVSDRVDYVRCPAGDAGCRAQFRRFPGYGDNNFTFWRTDGSSDYDSLQAQFITRFGRGSQFQASYTLADFNADTSMFSSSGGLENASTVTDDYRGLDDGRADMFRRHIFNASAIYNLPTFEGQGGVKEWLAGNWSIGGIIIYSSGTPLTVYAPNPSGDLDVHPAAIGYRDNARPLSTGVSCSGGGDKLQILNPGAYTLTGYQLGDTSQQMSRGTCDGPDFFQTDLSFYKNFPFQDRFNLQLRFEIFNVFDTVNIIGNSGVETNFNAPVTLDGPRDQATQVVATGQPASNFGRATRARDARQFQLGVKFSF